MYVNGKQVGTDAAVTAGEAANNVGDYVKSVLHQKYPEDGSYKIGLATIKAKANGKITISTKDFEEKGTISAQSGTLSWGGGMAPTNIKVGNDTIDLSTLDEDTVGQYYGATVATLDGKTYGLFYVDYTGKYGDEGTIYLRAKESVGSTALNSDSLGITENSFEIMKQINPGWAGDADRIKAVEKFLDSTKPAANIEITSAEKATLRLCNSDITTWSGAKSDAITKWGESKVNYVIGGPSVEMFLDSYNARYSSETTKYTAHYKGAGEVYTYPGYLYSNDGGTSTTISYSGAIKEADTTTPDVGGMYRNTSADEWLASPLSYSYDGYACFVLYSGSLDYHYWSNSYGVAPLVSLKSGVDLTANN